ncbi:hypothetical protein BC830DRAFT_1165461 [Chytriomyces sp. MP71]|nr:hypothetical protein BC830DRAFT_1165461 [Chytriomyces sp. MP71]
MEVPGSTDDDKTAHHQLYETPSSSGDGNGWGFSHWGAASWVEGLVDTVKKQTENVAIVLERDISEFISVVVPSDSQALDEVGTVDDIVEAMHDQPPTDMPAPKSQQPPSSDKPIESWRFDDATGTLHAESFHSKQTDNDLIAPRVTRAVESALTNVRKVVTSADHLLGVAEGYLEKVDLGETVDKMEALADRAEDFLESVETQVWEFFGTAISSVSASSGAGLAKGALGAIGGALEGVVGAGAAFSGVGGSAQVRVPPANIIFDRRTATILALRHAESTYIADPSALTSTVPSERDFTHRYTDYKSQFDISNYAGQISRIFEDDAEVRALLTKVVPAVVSYDEFWMRYFFRVSEVDREEEARKRLMNEKDQDADMNEEEFAWDDDSSDEEHENTVASGSQKQEATPTPLSTSAAAAAAPSSPSKTPSKPATPSATLEKTPIPAATMSSLKTPVASVATTESPQASKAKVVAPLATDDEVAALLAETSVSPPPTSEDPVAALPTRRSTDAATASGSDGSYDVVTSEGASSESEVAVVSAAKKEQGEKPEEETAEWDTWE